LIYLFTALYPEAKPLIRVFSLKRVQDGLPFDVYENADTSIRLVISGTGMCAAAAATAAVFGRYRAANEDHLINIGTCAGEVGTDEMSGTAYLCHKLTDRNTGHTYYPDMLFHHAFAEAQLITEPVVWRGTEDSEALRQKAESAVDGDTAESVSDGDLLSQSRERAANREAVVLHDMEGAAIYQAGSYWLGPHQMSFIKVISDHGTDQRITPKTLEQAVENGLDVIKDYVSNIGQIIAQNRRNKEWETECSRQTERLCEELHCSQTMRLAVIQCVRYWTLAGVDHNSLLEQMRADGELPCRDRREGKKRFDELKQRLL
jgi:nucleoside phosphorylase